MILELVKDAATNVFASASNAYQHTGLTVVSDSMHDLNALWQGLSKSTRKTLTILAIVIPLAATACATTNNVVTATPVPTRTPTPTACQNVLGPFAPLCPK